MAATILKRSEDDPTIMELVQEFLHFIWIGIKFFAFIGAVILVFIAIGGLIVLAVLGVRNGIWSLIDQAQRRKPFSGLKGTSMRWLLGWWRMEAKLLDSWRGEILEKAAIRWIMELVGGPIQRYEGGGIDGGRSMYWLRPAVLRAVTSLSSE